MAPPLIVRAYLDVVQYLKASDSVVSTNTAMGDSALIMGTDFTKSATQVVAANLKVVESQRALLGQYEAIGAAAKAGSDEQKVAAVQAAKVQAILNRSLGVTAVTTAKAGGEAKKAERDLGKLSRGALAGTGLFSKLGRSLAFASTGFIAVAGGATVIAESIRQAEGLAAAQRQVDQQLKVSGKSWDQYGGKIDKALLKEGHLAGFTRQDLLQAFGYLLRVGGNVSRSLNLTALAADVARGRSISLQAASIALSKALGGSATALRRLGIIVPNNVTKLQALEYVQKKFTGQAKEGTTESQRLGSSLADTGATIGTILLPTFDRIATGISNWLSRMNQSGKLTKDFADVTTLLGHGFHILGGAIATVDKITGGFGHTLLLIGEIWAGIAITGWIKSLRELAITWGLVTSAAEKAAAAEAAAASVSAAGIATGDLRAAALAEAGQVGLLGRLGGKIGGLGVAGRFGLGAGIAIGGQVLGNIAGGAIGGRAGAGVNQTIALAGLGAGIGTAIAPGVGTAVGAGLGALLGAVTGFIHAGPSFTQQATAMARSVTTLGAASKQSARDILGLRANLASGAVARDDAQQALRQAQAQEKATRGTSAHQRAVDELVAAQYQLKVANEQLVVTQENLNAKQRQHAQQVKDDQRNTAALAKQLADVSRQVLRPLAGEARGESPAFAMLSPLEKYISKLGDLQSAFQKTDPPMAKVIKNLLAIVNLTGRIPNAKTVLITLQETLAGQFQLPRVGPGGALFAPNFRPGPGTSGTGAQPAAPPPPAVWTGFQLTLREQIAQVQASMTKTIADDVALAKEIIARIKHLIDIGHVVPGTKGYLAALEAQANAESTLQAAEQQKAQQRQAAAQKALELASTYNTPIDLQIAQVQAEMTKTNKDDIRVLKQIIAAARKALASGKKNKQGRLAILQTILSAQQALESLLGGGDNSSFTLPLKLQLALAKAQALGQDQVPILLKMRAALYRALKASKGNIQKQTDIWNQIYGINQQLQSDVTTAYGAYKKASLKRLTQGKNLTADERRALEEILSQRGPGGTIPSQGTGAAGYIIGPDGRPIHRHPRHHRGSQYGAGGGGGGTPTINANIDLNVYIDGKHVEAVVTKRQQRYRRRNPQSRRGPHAGTPTS